MNISEPFIRRPIATTLLTVAVGLSGAVAYTLLPVAPLPQVDFPTISVSAGLPGASPETVATSMATPLERQLGSIAGVDEMTSTSTLGSTAITLQFDLSRDINGAARDVQAAINAARGYLPANLPNNPTYRLVNPADTPIVILSLTSDVLDSGAIYDAASTVLAQKLSQINGVGEVVVGGSSLPAVRIELNPDALNRYQIGLEDVRTVLSGANANTPKGFFSDGYRTHEVDANDQIFKAADYAPLLVAYRNGYAVRVSDVGEAIDSVQDVRNAGFVNGKRAVLVVIFKQPAANVINTVDQIRASLPQLVAAIPRSIDVQVAMDQTLTIRASVQDIEITLAIAVCMVVLVVFAFLKNVRMTLIPGIAVPVSLIGTFGVMYLLGFSLDNLSLMALTISTGFVVDDAIVVVENITRHREQGVRGFEAALLGAREIGFTVLSISVSLVAVFIPILMMGGIVGRLMHEFAVTLSIAILVSLLVSLTTTPTMCAHLLKEEPEHGRLYRASERAFAWVVALYGRTLQRVLQHPALTLIVLLGIVVLNGYLFVRVPKGFFPEQDNGRMMGQVIADQDFSFQAMESLLVRIIPIVQADPGVQNVVAFTGGQGGTTSNTARMFIILKPLNQRKASAQQIITRLRPKLARVPGASTYLVASQDVRVGGRLSAAEYQFTMTGDNLPDLNKYGPLMLRELQHVSLVADVNSDQENKSLQSMVEYDRSTDARFNISPELIDNVLYDAFGQREVSTMYEAQNQYYVVMEAAPRFWEDPLTLHKLYVKAPSGQEVPLDSLARYTTALAPLQVNHQGLFPAATISFNLRLGVALSDAVAAIQGAAAQVHLPTSIHTEFAGTAQAFQQSLGNEPQLIAAALAAVYIVLGVLYESFIHPITILSTLPSAGVGALLALLLFHIELTIIAMIGMLLLIGIVKKNAILMIDFALAAEREEGKNSRDAIYEACMLRFRPILMTTMAAMLGALPLAMGTGMGWELRQPLGITIIGGLIVSQLLTLYTTPVVYLFLDRFHKEKRRA
jgi:hydrophobe/amphiphile efflux-1 (HAE1) family protein